MRLEGESDFVTTSQAHDEGYRPYVLADGGASGGRYVSLSHYYDTFRVWLYFARNGLYTVSLRYILDSGRIDLRLDNVTHFTWPTRGSWGVSNGTLVVSSPGWHYVDLYQEGVNKGSVNAGIDYAEVSLATEYFTCTVTGTVSASTGPLPNARVALLLDQATAPLPGATAVATTDAGGNYTLTGVAGSSVRVSAQAVGCQRVVRTLAPATSLTANFYLGAGAMYLEPEADMQVDYQHHTDGFKPSTQPEASCTSSNYLVYPHYWGRATSYFYFPTAKAYPVQLRYRTTDGTMYLELDNSNPASEPPVNAVWTLPVTGGNWVKTNAMITVASAGWHYVGVAGLYFLKAFPGQEGVDYLRIGTEPPGVLIILR